MGRWIANQSSFNYPDANTLNEVARAAVVTAVTIYNLKEEFQAAFNYAKQAGISNL